MSESTTDFDVNEAAANAKKLALSTNSAAPAPWTPYVFDFYSQIPPPNFYQNSQLGNGGLNFMTGSNFAPPPIPQLSMPSSPRHGMPPRMPHNYRPPPPFYTNDFTIPPPRFPPNNQNAWNKGIDSINGGSNEEVVERVARNPEGPKPIRFSLNPTGRKNHVFNKPNYINQGQGGMNNNNKGGSGNKQHVSRFGPPIAPLQGTVKPLPDPYTTQLQNSLGNQGSQKQESLKYGLASGSSWASSLAGASTSDVSSSSTNRSSAKGNEPNKKKEDAESACISVENWSPSLKKYAEEWFTAVFSTNPDLADRAQELLRKKLEDAYRSGEFRTKDWSKEPLPFLTLPSNSSSLKNGFNVGAIPGTVKGTPLKPDVFAAGRGRGRGGRGGRSRTSPIRGEAFKTRQAKAKGIRGRDRFRSNSRSWSRSRSRSSSGSSDNRSKKRKRNDSGNKYAKKKGKKEKAKNGKKNSNKDKKGESHFYSEYGAIGGGVSDESKARLNARAARFAKDQQKSSPKGTMKSRLGGFINNSSRVGPGSTGQWAIDTNPSSSGAKGGRALASWDMNSRIVGTSMDLEKMYLRLTTAPDPSTIRPVHILKKSLKIVCEKWKASEDYHYTCDQLKAIRQDLTVQRVRDSFTIVVYETHARIALEKGDHEEFNQCQSQLVQLYDSVKCAKDNHLEFMAYRILYYIFTTSTLDLGTVLGSLSEAEKQNECIAHALRIHSAWAIGNYCRLFSLRKESPKMSGYMIEWFMNRERKLALKKILKSYRQTVPKSFLIVQLDLDGEKGWNEFLKATNLEQAIIYSDAPANTKINARDSQVAVFAALQS